MEVAHRAEDVLGKLRSGELAFNRDIGDAILKAVDFIGEALSLYSKGEEARDEMRNL